MRRVLPVMVVAALLGAAVAEAAPRGRGAKDAGAADASASDAGAAEPAANDGGAADLGDGGLSAICIEHVPPGATRPVMREELSSRGTSGYAAELKLVITHGKGETVLPEGFRLQAGSDAAKELQRAGFVVPDPGGGVAPKITVEPGAGGTAVTTITLPVVPLPPKPGRNVLELPPLPIAIARANNEYVTICTQRHLIQIEDPIANELDPKVHPNPPGRVQREDWPLARQIAVALPVALLLTLAGALGYRWWSRRPRIEKAKPRIPPWVTALDELESIRRSSLLEDGKTGEHFDRVSETLRVYLGARYGFETVGQGANGLETTTGEMLDLLKRVRPAILELPRIKDFLDDCDLVKFARFTPTDELCQESLARGEMIVRRTIPVMQLQSPPPVAGEGVDHEDERRVEHRDVPPDDLPPPEASS